MAVVPTATTGWNFDPRLVANLFGGNVPAFNAPLPAAGMTPTQMATGGYPNTTLGGPMANLAAPAIPTSEGGAVYSQPGQAETLLNQIFSGQAGATGAALGKLLAGGGNPFINQLSRGQIPPALLQQFQRQQALQNAGITESFGRVGARFGTDLAGTLGIEAGNALNDLAVNVINRALEAQQLRQYAMQTAVSQALGLGQNLAGTEFSRQENALTRALQEFLNTNPLFLLQTLGAF